MDRESLPVNGEDKTMCSVRCTFCNRYVLELIKDGRCKECEIEYKTVVAGITKRYGGAIKKLSER